MRIYLDHNATTPPLPEVVRTMTRVLEESYGNASSVHTFGQRAKAEVDDARAAVAALLGAEATEIVFTGGGTEADNLALRGAADALEPTGRRHLITTGIEHEAVLNTVKALERRGWRTTVLSAGSTGVVSPEALGAVLTAETGIVSIMHANNEVGTIQPIADLAPLVRAKGALFHTDAVQSVGKIPVSVKSLGADLLSLSAHKFGGPKGVGALWIRRGVRLVSQMTGGRHERSRRAGTENVPAIAGFGVAARFAASKLADAARIGALRDDLECGILAGVSGTIVNGDPTRRVPNTTNISFDGIEAESLLIALDLEGVAVSTGSACSSGSLEPSHVLRAMNLPSPRTRNSLRFSLGPQTTADEVAFVVDIIPSLVGRLRQIRSRGHGGALTMRVVVAMSGGVDSSVAASLLVEAGHDVVGVSMQLYDQRDGAETFGSCCSLDDLYDARRVAASLGIPHYILNFEEQFKTAVVRNFVDEYAAGRTPIPCAHCNADLKFASLVDRAAGFEAGAVATGHYARVDFDEERRRYRLLRSVDTEKDQTYFLFALTQDQLAHAMFPVGHLTKREVRAHAERARLIVADKPDSHEICFVPDGDTANFVERHLDSPAESGDIVDSGGQVLGQHRGIHRYTVGQRKGLGISASIPMYVLKLEPVDHRIVVGPREELGSQSLTASTVNWIAGAPPDAPRRVTARIRHRHADAPATVVADGDSRASLTFDTPQVAVTPGQAVVFYDGDEVIGGGWIDSNQIGK